MGGSSIGATFFIDKKQNKLKPIIEQTHKFPNSTKRNYTKSTRYLYKLINNLVTQ